MSKKSDPRPFLDPLIEAIAVNKAETGKAIVMMVVFPVAVWIAIVGSGLADWMGRLSQ